MTIVAAWFKGLFILSALVKIAMAGFFGICLMQYDGVSQYDHVIIGRSGVALERCPLLASNVQKNDSRVTEWFFWEIKRSVVTDISDIWLIERVIPNEKMPEFDADRKLLLAQRLDLPISITPPALAKAFSRGILHPKKDFGV